MGYAANGWCFDTAAAAAAYVCGHDYPAPAALSNGPTVSSGMVECTGTSGNALTILRTVNGATPVSSTLSLTPPPCDTTEYRTYHPFSMSAADGASIGGAVLTVWLGAWAFRAVRKALGGRAVGGDDDASE